MENRKNLHDYSLVLILLSLLDIVSIVTGSLASFFDGTVDKAITNAPSDIASYIRPVYIGIIVFSVILTAAQILIGAKGLKVSKTPSAAKGYITAAKIFLVLNVIGVVGSVSTLVQGEYSDLFDAILSMIIVALDVFVYAIYIKVANAVRKDFLKN